MSDSGLERRGVVERKHLSFSQLNQFHDCGLKYDLSYIQKVPRRSGGAFFGGIAIHKAIEISEGEGWWVDPENFLPDGIAVETFQAVMTDKVRSVGGEENVDWAKRGGEDLAWWLTSGGQMLRRYQKTRARWAAEGWGQLADETEVRFDMTLEGLGIPVTGYLDKFLMHEGGEPLIADWKTGRIGSASPLQFATYARMVEQATGLKITRGVAVFLRAQDEDRRIGEIRFADVAPRIDALYASLATAIDSGSYLPNDNAWHTSCAVRDSCWYWQAIKPEGD